YRGREINVLRSLPVREVMQNDPVVIDAGTPFAELVKLFLQSRHSEFFVLDNHQRFAGRISLGDVRRLMQEEQYLADIVVAHDLVNPNVATIHPEDSLDQVMRIFGRYAVEELPVVDSLNPDRVIGVVFYKDVIEAYNHELMKRDLLSETGASLKMLEKSQKISFLDGYAMMEIPIPMGFAGKSLHELNLRHRFGVNILMIKRRQAEGGYKQIVPLPHEVLKLDDRLIAMGKEKDLQKLQHA
ncbi:MAG: CBS domain-containing protein, partial [Calditrichaeota bacterium]|nr:CBS domain-containing protein [Calditrichota bacterium]